MDLEEDETAGEEDYVDDVLEWETLTIDASDDYSSADDQDLYIGNFYLAFAYRQTFCSTQVYAQIVQEHGIESFQRRSPRICGRDFGRLHARGGTKSISRRPLYC